MSQRVSKQLMDRETHHLLQLRLVRQHKGGEPHHRFIMIRAANNW